MDEILSRGLEAGGVEGGLIRNGDAGWEKGAEATKERKAGSAVLREI